MSEEIIDDTVILLRPVGPAGLVLAAPFRAHVRHLCGSTGTHWRVVAHAAGVPVGVVRRLLDETRRGAKLSADDAAALLALTPRDLRLQRHRQIDAAAVRPDVVTILAAGVAPERLARTLGVSASEVLALADGSPGCTEYVAHAAAAIAELVLARGDRRRLRRAQAATRPLPHPPVRGPLAA